MSKLVYQAARDEAATIRSSLGQEDGPIDLMQVAGILDAEVHFTPLRKLSGMVIKKAGQSPEVYVNSLESPQRQRFTLAHEIGHLVERSAAGDQEYSFEEGARARGAQYDLHEFYADEFAGALLMPAEELRQLKEQGYSEVAIAAHFGVSIPALVKRQERLKMHPDE